MRVESMQAAGADPLALQHRRQWQQAQAHKHEKQNAPAASIATTAARDTQPTAAPAEKEEVPGVIRLLEAGHFKGVADVRLRINFFDQLSERAGARAATSAGEGFDSLVHDVNTKADELLGGLELDEETQAEVTALRDQLDADMQAAVKEATAEGKVDTSALSQALHSAFADFASGMQALFPPPAADEPTDEPVEETADESETPTAVDVPAEQTETPEVTDVPVDAVETPVAAEEPAAEEPASEEPATVDITGILDNFNQAFTQSVNDFISGIELVGQLPPLSPAPSNNGSAYDKFLAMYNDMLNPATGETTDNVAEQPAVEPLDELA